MKSTRAKTLAFLIALAFGVGLALWFYRFKTYHYAEVSPGVLYRDGNRSMIEFATACRKSHAKTVVMLNDDQELAKSPFKEEVDYCKQNGIELIRVPIKLGGWPRPADVDRFLKLTQDKSKQPLLVHCAQGVRRTGMLVAAYQQSVLGYDDARATQAILPFGRKPTRHTLADLREFITDYDEKTGALKETNTPGRESDE